MPESPASFLSGGGTAGALIRAFDWRSTPLGAPQDWPHPLRTVVGIMLNSQQPMRLIWGPECTLLYNDGYIPILGARHPQALGQPFRDVWPELWPQLVPILERVYAGEGLQQDNIHFTVQRNGYPEEANFSFSYSPVRDAQDEVAGIFCSCRETTVPVRDARARSAENDRLRDLFEQAPSFMAVLRGPAHRFELANGAYKRLVGLSDLVGRAVREALPGAAGQGFFELLDQVYRTGVPHVGTGVPLALDGPDGDAAASPRVLNFVYQPIRNAAGAVDGIFVEGNDVTAEHEATRRLRELNDTLEARVEARSRELSRWWRGSPDLKAILDTEGRLTAVNPTWHRLLGHPDGSLPGTAFDALLHPEDRSLPIAERAGTDAAPSPPFRCRMQQRDGSWRHVEWMATHDRETARIYAVGRDVTSEHARAEALAHAEEQLRQAQKMEAIGQLTGGIAHDFNNMLQGIVVPLQLIQRRVHAGQLEGIDRYAAAGLASAQRAASLTQRLLAFSRRQPLQSRAVDVQEALRDIATMLQGAIGENVALAFDIQPGIWPAATDLHQLHNALLNLAINARDAMPGGGSITVLAENMGLTDKAVAGVRGLAPGDYVRIAVRDTGVGMDEDVIAKAFDPFFTTKPIGQGTGLGLSMIYGYARQSGGYAAIESAPGQGTTVKLYLPRSAATMVPGPNVSGTAQAGMAAQAARTGSVLVVEDDTVVRQLVVELLREQGYQVTQAPDGHEGMHLLSGTQHFDLLLTDVGLPGPNGRQLADYARERLPEIRVVLMTGYAEEAAMRANFPSPTMELLVKPFDADRLVAKVNDLMARPAAPTDPQ